MASYYGSWVASDDYRAVLDVTTGTGDGKTTYTISGAVKVESLYGYASWGVSATLKVAGSTKATASDKSMPTGQTTTLISSTTTTISRTHSSQSITVSGSVSAAGTPYNGATSTASTTVTVPAKASYVVSYNANGGSGAPSSQTKWHGETLTLSSTAPTRTGYTFQGWATSSSSTTVAYAAGASYTTEAALSLYAVWQAVTYAVTYNANGGSGSVSSQTKTYGVALTLRSNSYTRSSTTSTGFTVTFNHNYSGSSGTSSTATNTVKYTFSKWNTAANGSGTSYAAGASYTANAAATMYAQWTSTTTKGSVTLPSPTRSGYTFGGWYKEAACSTKVGNGGASYTPTASTTLYAKWTANYTAPTLGSISAVRCTSGGAQDDDGGTYCKVTLKFAQGSVAASSHSYTLSATATGNGQTETGSASTSSGSADSLSVTFGRGNLDVEKRYAITATLSDGTGTLSKTTVLTPCFFTLDFLAGGKGVAIGQTASETGLHVAMDETLEGKHLNVKSSNITKGTVPSSDTIGNGRIRFLDSGGSRSYGEIDPVTYSSDIECLRILQIRAVGDETLYNGIAFRIAADGTRSISGWGGTGQWLDFLGLTVATHSPTLTNATATKFETRRQGNVVNLSVYQLKVTSSLADGSSVSLGTGIIGSNARPTNVVYLPLVANVSGKGAGVFMSIGTGGNVTVYNRSGSALGTGTNLMGNTSWVI